MHPAFQANLYADALNLLQLWLHGVLLHRGIYPPSIFHQRTAFNLQVYVAQPGLLADYVSKFAKEVEAQKLSKVSK
jgi:hypothetical protein